MAGLVRRTTTATIWSSLASVPKPPYVSRLPFQAIESDNDVRQLAR